MDSSALSILARPGNLTFQSNRKYLDDFPSGGTVRRLATGHFVFYGPHRRRILATDPEGNPLHECEWGEAADGGIGLNRARFRLDWGKWIGLKPSGLVNTTVLDLSKKPGWQRLRADDLRRMAAQALRVPFEEVRFFYGDDDLKIDGRGRAAIRHRKDALYILDDGTFNSVSDRVRFMACMGAMHWSRIDFLPVVELFQSLLPGTGSAAFELIRGLYDDQNAPPASPLPLRYRGIPTYPSEAAFRLFSGFFTPKVGTGDPFEVFMDPPRSHEVIWLPSPDPPRRHFDSNDRLSVTIKGTIVQKVTLANDATGLSYVAAVPGRIAGFLHSVSVVDGELILRDDGRQTSIPIQPSWGTLRESDPISSSAPPSSWRALFAGQPPSVPPEQAFSAVLLYPDGEREIDEAASQPFVADHVEDLLEQQPDIARKVHQADRVLVDLFDASFLTCLHLDRPRDYTFVYRRPEFAQKQAQLIWNALAHAGRLDWLSRLKMWPQTEAAAVRQRPYDLIYAWMPFSTFADREALKARLTDVVRSLQPGGYAFITGPSMLSEMIDPRVCRFEAEAVESLPTFRTHQAVLPYNRLKPGLTVWHLLKL